MKGKLLIFFVLLLLGLILCSFLGGNKFYNEFMEGFSTNSYDSDTFTAPDGSTAVISSDSNGQSVATVTPTSGSPITYTQNSSNEGSLANSILYNGPNGSTALLMDASKTGGLTNFQTKDSNGVQVIFKQNGSSKADSSTTDSTSSTTDNSNQNSNYDNYNHYNGSSYPSEFHGPNGGTARIIQTPTNNTIVITNKNGTTEIYYINKNAGSKDMKSYYGPNGGSAKVITLKNGNQAIEIVTPNGSKVFYYSNSAQAQTSHDSTINQYTPETNTTGSDYTNAFANINPYSNNYTNPYINTNTITGPAGNTYSTYDSSAYTNSLPQGIPKSMILPGQEDLYILKSQVVPPVCPKCPEPIVQCPDNNDVTKCPPCPPCSRCPEPSFSCQKVPNYNAFNQDYMPVPVLNSFSGFGM
jgi:hypothetical protein